MTQLSEAVARYHKILEGDHYKDLSWAHELQERMKARNLAVSGRPVSPVLRPHFITRRQYTGLVKAVESFSSAIERIENLAIGNPTLLARMELLPAEKMLAAVDPGYASLTVTSLIDTHLNNGTMRFARYIPDTPTGVAYGEALSDLFYDAPPVKQLRKRYHVEKLPGTKYLLQAILKAYKEWGGKRKKPNIAILEFRQPFQTTESGENALIADLFRKEGLQVEVVSPDQIEYRNDVLRSEEHTSELQSLRHLVCRDLRSFPTRRSSDLGRERADRRSFPQGRIAGGSGLSRSDRIPERCAAARRFRNRPGVPPHQSAGVSDPVRFDASAAARLSRSRGVRGEQFPIGAGSEEGHLRLADRRIHHGGFPGRGTARHPRVCSVDARGARNQDEV